MWQQMKSAFHRSGERHRNRRDYACLVSMDDHLLRDIGVHRGDLRAKAIARAF